MHPKARRMIALGGALMLGTSLAQASQTAKHEAQELHRVNVTLIEAIINAEKAGGGKATSAEFQFKRGNPALFEVKVLSSDGSKLTRYELNPHTGEVQKTDNEKLEKLLTRLNPAELRRAPTVLTHAIAVAQEHSGGAARSADVHREGDRLEYEIETVKVDGTLHKVKVNGADGNVVSDESEK